MNDRIWTISNGLSTLRVVLVVPMVFCLVSENPSSKYYAVGIIVLAILTDVSDGFLARKLNQVTEVGKIIDPLADKIALIAVTFVLTQQEKIPLWFFVSAVARDILILLGGIYVKKKKRIVLQSILLGKLTVVAISLYMLVVILNVSAILWLKEGFLALSTLMLVTSFTVYLKRYFEIMKPDA